MRNFLLLSIAIMAISTGSAQYQFTHTVELDCTPVKNQSRTGTCWSFATSSFVESELMRMGKGQHDLSEMYVVRNIYQDKADNYVFRQGKANFSQGSLSHDMIAIVKKSGVMPEAVYSGLLEGEHNHDHSEMEAGLKGYLDGIMSSKKLSKKWRDGFGGILDAYMGPVETSFEYDGQTHTPQSLAKALEIDADDYVSITSFAHSPFNEYFILNIPDNYSNGSFLNVPLDKMIDIVDKALKEGYTIAWDGDVSEKGFDAKKGIAVLPEKPTRKDLFDKPGPEINTTQALRQDSYENMTTTDDHLMHILGKAKDQNGTEYYIIKNSWGAISPYKGYLYMSKEYLAMKTISIMVHKDIMDM